ncbi:polyprenyl synthetase family protein [Amycolatopsis sp. NPDC051045]|uniref:polyprenyl synthetase family protein n=1 Tax=Amycolatopsis sp. NPDC051045 TaxID=3156922 RepID=UPI00343116B5
MLTACAGFGRPDAGRVARLGAVVELVHLASLVHDDVIDRAAIRRGGPAAHRTAGPETGRARRARLSVGSRDRGCGPRRRCRHRGEPDRGRARPR